MGLVWDNWDTVGFWWVCCYAVGMSAKGYLGESRSEFRERLRKVGALASFDAERRRVCEDEGLDMGDAFRIVAPEYGYQRGPVPPQYRESPDVDELKMLERELLEKKAQAGNPRTGLANTEATWQMLAVAVAGRRSTGVKDIRWVYQNLLTPVDMLDVAEIPSAGALGMLRVAQDDPKDFVNKVFARVLARDQERDEMLSEGEKADDELLSGAIKWAKEESVRIREREQKAQERSAAARGSLSLSEPGGG